MDCGDAKGLIPFAKRYYISVFARYDVSGKLDLHLEIDLLHAVNLRQNTSIAGLFVTFAEVLSCPIM